MPGKTTCTQRDAGLGEFHQPKYRKYNQQKRYKSQKDFPFYSLNSNKQHAKDYERRDEKIKRE